MLVIIFSILDILAGIFLLFGDIVPGKWILYLGIILLLKGLFFLGSGIAAGTFEWMSIIDIVVGIMLVFHLEVGWFAIVPIIKGIYCVVLSLFVR